MKLAKPLIINGNREALTKRLLGYVEKTNTCWLFTGHLDKDGYGQLWYDGRAHWSHRISYALFVGPIESDHDVHHRQDVCQNHACCNPEHLESIEALKHRNGHNRSRS